MYAHSEDFQEKLNVNLTAAFGMIMRRKSALKLAALKIRRQHVEWLSHVQYYGSEMPFPNKS